MWELIVLLCVIFSVMACGVVPVWFRIRGEKNPSPWAFSINEAVNKEMTDVAATQIPVSVITPTIPLFNPQHENVEVAKFNEMNASVPDEELWDKVEDLLKVTMEIPIFNEQYETPEATSFFNEKHIDEISSELDDLHEDKLDFNTAVSSLTSANYDSIRMNYGERVAEIITCTPYQGCLGAQVMIGKFTKEGSRFEFDQDWVELKNDIPHELDGEIIVVKGDFLADGSFYVQHWEDPMMIDAGYSSLDWPEHQAQ